MNRKKIKLLYLASENTEAGHIGYHNALSSAVKSELIESYQLFPFTIDEIKTGSWSKTVDNIFTVICEYKPELLVISHIGKRSFPDNFFDRIKKYCPSIVIGYDERDVYGYFRKPLPIQVIKLALQCDVIFLVSAGTFANRFRNKGCKNVLYLSHVADSTRFGNLWKPTDQREFDVIMIMNRSRSKIPFKSMPGIKKREKLVKEFSSAFGEKFAVFGSGWHGYVGSKGVLPYDKQEFFLRKSWISVGQDHFPDYECYFSDRLPISLISGVAHLASKQPGIENFFTHGIHCMFFSDPEEAVYICKQMLKWPKEELIAMGERGSKHVSEHFTEIVRMKRLIRILQDEYEKKIRFITYTDKCEA